MLNMTCLWFIFQIEHPEDLQHSRERHFLIFFLFSVAAVPLLCSTRPLCHFVCFTRPPCLFYALPGRCATPVCYQAAVPCCMCVFVLNIAIQTANGLLTSRPTCLLTSISGTFLPFHFRVKRQFI